MSGAAKQLLDQLQTLGLVAPEKLANYLPPRPLPSDVQELARDLIRRGELTKFQAQELLSGRGKKLVLGNYVLLDKLGAGGMGQVFKAHHKRMKRVVAIKTLPSSVTKDPTALGRFQREVEAAAKLTHAHVVAAFDADEADGVYFLVMEFVDGPDLNQLLKQKGPLPVADVTKFIAQAADGLAFAHAKGVVHRDIKPGNLLIDGDGTVKLLDLGLARLEEEATSGPRPDQQDLTQAGLMMGTVDFMAPEQARNLSKADAKSDVYSLGCTLHRLLTGAVLFPGETVVDKLWAHRENPIPSLRAARPDVPPPLDALFQRMVAKKPDDRPTMAEVAAQLKAPQAVAAKTVPMAMSLPAAVVPEMSAPIVQTMPAMQPGPAIRIEPNEPIFAPSPSASSATISAGPVMADSPTVSSSVPLRARKPATAPAKKLNPLVLLGVGAAVIVVLAVAVGMMLGGKGEPATPPAVALAPKAAAPNVPAVLLPKAAPPSVLAPLPVNPPVAAPRPTPSVGNDPFNLPPTTAGNSKPAGPTPPANPIATSPTNNSIFTPGAVPPPTPAAPPTPSAALPPTPAAQVAAGSGLFALPSPGFGSASPPPGPPRANAPFDTAQAKQFQKSWADYLGIPVATQNAASGVRFVLIPPGTFLMGSSEAEIQAAIEEAKLNDARPVFWDQPEQEGPQHKVTLTKPFLCGETEVTMAQFEKFVKATGYVTLHERAVNSPDSKVNISHKFPWSNPPYTTGPSYPVSLVSWNDAAAFCNWLSKEEGLLPMYPNTEQDGREISASGNGYGLLSEAQWEYACRAGTQTTHFFGNDLKLLDDYVWHYGNSSQLMNPVGKKLPNPFGVYDMHGNASEWVADYYKKYTAEEAVDPLMESRNILTPLRGRIMDERSGQYRSAVRRNYLARTGLIYAGFRVARTLEPIPAKAK